MKICSNCGAEVGDSNAFCVKCGASLGVQGQNANNAMPNQGVQQKFAKTNNSHQQNVQYVMKPNYDHTEEFDEEDVSDNKVLGMVAYLDVVTGVIGAIIALIGAKDSKYAGFHARQSLKIVVAQLLLTVCWSILFLIIGLPIMLGSIKAGAVVLGIFGFLYGIGYLILFIARIVAFFQVCTGKAVEPIVIRYFGFMR